MNRGILSLVIVAAFAQPAHACSVPVFRYALEHWRPDPFMVVVFHRGELSGEQQRLLKQLEPAGPDGVRTINLMAKAIDVDNETDPRLLELWKLQNTTTLPWMAVHAPVSGGPPQRIWAGEFNPETVAQLKQSPARKEIAERLLSGDSVVWVFLEGGNAEADDASFALLSRELSRLQKELKLPEIEAADLGEISTLPESLRLSFSTVRIARTDPQEVQFVNMLLHVEPDLMNDEYAGEPMVFPVFGRGRVLYSLVGEGITPATIEDAARFLVGECQCVVKVQNPGVDSLMSVAWERYFAPTPEVEDTRPLMVDMSRFAKGAAAHPKEVEGGTAAPIDGNKSAGSANPPGAPADGPLAGPPGKEGEGELLSIDSADLEGDAAASTDEPAHQGAGQTDAGKVDRHVDPPRPAERASSIGGYRAVATIMLALGAVLLGVALFSRSR